jgi:NAD(P)-dependent dehydrogenase (short-subunit alcohol dehydrogenase family)
MFSFDLTTLPRLDGKRAVVTGANSGLGLETAWMLASRGASVVMACRSPERAASALEVVRQRAANAEISTVALDLASLKSVRNAAATLREGKPIDILVNNAGVMALPLRRTEDGFEMQLGTNHFGHFALTGLLFPHLTADARIVNLASGMHHIGRMRWDDLDAQKSYQQWLAYGQSKLANLLFTFALARRLAAKGSGRTALAAHPGYASTNLQHTGPKMEGSTLKSWFMSLANAVISQSAEKGAWPSVYAACAPAAKNGDYWGPAFLELWGAPRKSFTSSAARVEADQDRLWAISEERTAVSFEF